MPSPIIRFSTTSQFSQMYSDKGSGAKLEGAFYRPIPASGFYILGDYAQGNYKNPTGIAITISVENDDPANPVLMAPSSYNRIYKDKDSGADKDGSLWMPAAPSGYVALGAVSQKGYDAPVIPELRCLRLDQVKQATIGALIWSDQGSGAKDDVSVYQIDGMPGLFYAQPDFNAPVGQVWVPRNLP